MQDLYTAAGEALTGTPWNVYPRPQMQRDSFLNLNGKWDFTVKVTEGESTDAYNVAADKVAALVKIRTSLTTGTWVAPTAGNIEAVKLLGGNLIKVTVNFGDGTSGFMKVSE